MSGQGNGFVDIFDLDGVLIQRLVSNGNLNSPWGLALAPDQFGDFGKALLVGNFGDGTINAYDPASGAYLGALQDSTGGVISIPACGPCNSGTAAPAATRHALFHRRDRRL